MLATVVAESLGLEPGELSMVTADTDLTPVDLGSYSSRVTFMAGNAAIEAAERVRARIVEAVADELEANPGDLQFARGRVSIRGDPAGGVTWPEAVRMANSASGPLVESGSYRPPKLAGPFKGAGIGISPAFSYSACVVEVNCDAETGVVDVERVWLAHDIGRALNRQLVEGQVEGGVYMGLGEALLEEHAFRGGLHRAPPCSTTRSPPRWRCPGSRRSSSRPTTPKGPSGPRRSGKGRCCP